MIKNKKILLISPRFVCPPNDGAKIVIYNTIKQLAKTNTIDYITNFSKEDENHLSEMDSFVRKSFYILNDVTRQNFSLLLKSFLLSKSYLFLKFHDKRILKRIDVFFSETKYDMVWLESAFSTLYAAYIRKRYPHVKIVSRSHNTESLLLERIHLEEKSIVKRFLIGREVKFWKHIEINSFNFVDKVYAISPADREQFISDMPEIEEKIELLYPGVDVHKYNNSTGITQDKNIVFMGALNYFPNIQGINWFLEKVFLEVIKEDKDIKLIIVGNNALENLGKYKGNQNIEIVNGTNDDVKYFNKARIFLVPLMSGSGIKIKVLSSMSMGKAVLSTSIGAEGLDVVSGKNIIVSDNETEWVNQILGLMNDSQKLDELGNNAHCFIVDNFSWEETFKKIKI